MIRHKLTSVGPQLALILWLPFSPGMAHTLYLANGSTRQCAGIVMQQESLLCQPSKQASSQNSQVIPLSHINKIRYDNQITIPVVRPPMNPKQRSQAGLLEPEHHLHNGFFLRYSPQLGGHFSRYSIAGTPSLPSWKQKGGGFAHQIALGGAIDWNQILYLETTIQNKSHLLSYKRRPDIEPSWQERIRLGLGYNHYLNVHNYYLAASLGLEQWSFAHAEQGSRRSQAFYYSGVTFGREWWLSANWAMGLGLFATGAWTEGNGYHLSYGLTATVTYN